MKKFVNDLPTHRLIHLPVPDFKTWGKYIIELKRSRIGFMAYGIITFIDEPWALHEVPHTIRIRSNRNADCSCVGFVRS